MTLGVAAVLVTACAHAPPPAEGGTSQREWAKLTEQLAKSERRLTEVENRMALLESEAREIRHRLQVRDERPLRETVRIGAGVPRDGDPQGAEPRPQLRLHGGARSSASPAADSMPPLPVLEERLRVVPLPPDELVSMHAPPRGPEAEYRSALDLLRRREFERALAALSAFLVHHEGHPRTSDVLFWRGEAQFALADYRGALASFQGALRTDPTGERAPDALLKLGLCHRELGQPQAARAALQRLTREFPQSSAARLVSQEDAS